MTMNPLAIDLGKQSFHLHGIANDGVIVSQKVSRRRAQHQRRTAMTEYIGLDVSMKETAVSIRRGGERIWRGKCTSDPNIIAELVRKRAQAAKRIVFETGPLSVWSYHSLRSEGLPAVCIDARHAKAALDMAANKTEANDADGLAHLAEVGFFLARCALKASTAC